MRTTLVVAVTLLALAGCSSSSTTGSSETGTPSTSASVPSATASQAPSAAPGAFRLVSQDLVKEGPQTILDASSKGTAVVASVVSQTTDTDYDAGLVFSTDSGDTWRWGGIVAEPGVTFPDAIVATDKGAVMVGTTQASDAAGAVSSSAFIAVAGAPDYVPQQVQTPAEFEGQNVHLQDIATISGVLLVVGWEETTVEGADHAVRTAYMWRSSDAGATWQKSKITVPGSTDNSLEQIVFAPDGSWNLIGQAAYGDGANQYDALWLKSTDAGATFALMNQDVLSAPLDQGATRITFASDGSAAILGWEEVADGEAARNSALWVSAADQKLTRIGTTTVPVSGGSPPGEFINGIMWDALQLAAWGSATGAYPMDNVQFWGLNGPELTQSTMLSGDGTPLAVSKILVGTDSALAFGFRGKDLASADVAIWKGSAIQ